MKSPQRSSSSPRRTWRYWRRWLGLLAASLALTIVGTPILLGFITTYRLLNPPCGDNHQTPGDYGHPWEDITLSAQAGGRFRAYFIPGTNGAAIIIPPPYGGGRGARLDEADVLVRHGYAVFAFESRRCAGMGSLSLGYKETGEVGDALAYLQSRADVDPDRVGILGFSSAGATAVMSAAQFPAIRAVVAEGGYGDFAEGALGLGTGSTFLEMIYKESFAVSYRLLTGIDIDKLSPSDTISQIAPRPVLLVYGSHERSLPGAYRQLAAAGGNARLWVVEGAGHGNYLEVAGESYAAHIVAFFDRSLPDR
jgi:pimeloyl-ACP methyl ester carboxylesterase